MKQQRRSKEDVAATVLSDARRLLLHSKLDAIEIPGCDVTVTDELLGKGRFGVGYIEDYNGRNAACKVSRLMIVSCHQTQKRPMVRVVDTASLSL